MLKALIKQLMLAKKAQYKTTQGYSRWFRINLTCHTRSKGQPRIPLSISICTYPVIEKRVILT